MHIGEKIKRIRKENKLTQDAMAEKLYVTRTAVSKWERGRGLPSIDSILLISRTFDVPLSELMEGVSEKADTQPQAVKSEKKKRKYIGKYFLLSIIFAVLGLVLGFYADIFVCGIIALVSLALSMVMIIVHCFANDDFSYCFYGVLVIILIALFHNFVYPLI